MNGRTVSDFLTKIVLVLKQKFRRAVVTQHSAITATQPQPNQTPTIVAPKSNTPALPIEVIGVIIDALGDERDMNALKACCLTCRAFVHLSRKHLFSTLDINTTFPYRTWNFGQLLSISDPGVLDCILKFEFQITRCELEYPSLPTFLLRITKLESLFLSALNDETKDWSKLHKALQEALLHLMHLPTLTHFRLRWFKNFPVSAIVSCNNLISLNVGDVVLVEMDHLPTRSKPHMIQEYTMERLASSATHALLDTKLANGNPGFDFTMLKKLDATCEGPHDVSAILRFLEVAKNIAVFKLFAPAHVGLQFEHLARMTAPCARTLKILDLRAKCAAEPSESILSLCKELEEMSNRNVVEIIRLQIHLQPRLECLTGDAWGMLDVVLNNPGWSRLRHVSLDINLYPKTFEVLKKGLDALPETQLAGLAGSNSIDFKFTSRYAYYI
ncbi:hypothetical protein B0H34DRAFT_731755 [Crassisporium funariophilum]|nr:hypothetical protein B0H34DRAFT_731755 [Crassisporium funariophilum]